MALRVLLADESSTIKKVMQLSLQDFAVEVRSVAVGLDVVSVSKVFKPDIIFADILLSKKNGYDVCFDLKSDSDTKNTPVVLMWSGFMELDEQKFQHCKANARLEKPFDAEMLRNLVKDLVQKTKTNPISDYLTFAQLPDFQESSRSNLDSSLDTDETSDEFSSVPLTSKNVSPLADAWSESKLKDFSSINNENSEFELSMDAQVNSEGDFDEITFIDIDNGEPITHESINESLNKSASEDFKTISRQTSLNENDHSSIGKNDSFSLARQEEIFREESRKMIEKICWQILPEITERLVKEEINKLLKDVEKSI